MTGGEVALPDGKVTLNITGDSYIYEFIITEYAVSTHYGRSDICHCKFPSLCPLY